MPPVHLRIIPSVKRLKRQRRLSMESLETLERISGLTYALSELARSEDQGALKNLAIGVLGRAVSSECDSLREMVGRKEL